MPSPSPIALRYGRRVLFVGPPPRVVGVLCSLTTKFPPRKKIACDLVEVRLDITGQPADWLERCRAIEKLGWPVLLTLRLQAEGGKWDATDALRFPYFKAALQKLAAVDVEFTSELARPVARWAKRLGKVCVVSYHDFDKTPSAAELKSIISQAQGFASIIKISTRLTSPRDEEVLRSLLQKKWKRPLCVIGMGPDWSHTRVLFPRLGSCLTYGYLDKATAPGQMSATELTRKLRD